MEEIKSNKDLEVGKYYHCFAWGAGKHSIHRCYDNANDGMKTISRNNIWAVDGNNQALERWRIFPVEIPSLETIHLCSKHHGYGFSSDCAMCNSDG